MIGAGAHDKMIVVSKKLCRLGCLHRAAKAVRVCLVAIDLADRSVGRQEVGRDSVSVALAGFTPDEVALTVEQNVLTLEGRKSEKEERTFLHRGISARNFKRRFTLADHVEVKGARFENGLLVIELQREIPEAMKPRRIPIGGATPSNVTQIEAKAA